MVLVAQVGESDTDRILADYSLEMTAKDVPALAEAAELIPAGTLVNVTFLGNEDTRMRVAAARAARAAGFVPVPHIAARRLATQRDLEEFLDALAAAGAAERVVVIGGDPARPAGPYPDALGVITSGLLEKYGVRHVSVSGYPEGHPDIGGPVLWSSLESKRAALAERGLGASIITQFGFDADAVLRWIAEARGRGIGLPIRVGVPGPAGVRRLLRYAKRFGAVTSAGIVQKYGLSLTNLVGSAGPGRFVNDLAGELDPARHGMVRLHFYTFGGLAATAGWLREFRELASGTDVTSRACERNRRHFASLRAEPTSLPRGGMSVAGNVATLRAEAEAPARDRVCLTVHGPDRPGIVAAVTSVLSGNGANIVEIDQHSDNSEGGAFFQRTVFRVEDYPVVRQRIEAELGTVLRGEFNLDWRLTDLATPKRVAIFASRSDHCLLDLLWRQRRGELPMTIAMVISNRTNLAEDVRGFGVPFVHIPMSGPDRTAAEAEQLRLLRGNVDLVVLARYMQVLSEDFLTEVGVPVINIHHSFLPAFIGAAPYRKARERGVKLIGATAHYVTTELDAGPIIEQDVIRVSHRDSVEELARRGADVERQVLARAVLWHCQERVIRHGRQTIVF